MALEPGLGASTRAWFRMDPAKAETRRAFGTRVLGELRGGRAHHWPQMLGDEQRLGHQAQEDRGPRIRRFGVGGSTLGLSTVHVEDLVEGKVCTCTVAGDSRRGSIQA